MRIVTAIVVAATLAASLAARAATTETAQPAPTAKPPAAAPSAAPAKPAPSPAASPTANAAPAAAASPAPRKTSTTTDELAKMLDQAGLDYHREEDHLRVTFRWNDNRSQAVVLQPQPDIDDVPVLEIYSGVMELDQEHPLTLKVAQRLLEATGDQSLGYFGIEDVEGRPWVFCYHNLPSKGLTPQVLERALRLVGELADEMEKEQTGKDEF